MVKRLVALPGDKVSKDSVVLAVIRPLLLLVRPNQVKTLPPYSDVEVVVPEGHGWLEGDAPFNSEDSNHFGPVSIVQLSK